MRTSCSIDYVFPALLLVNIRPLRYHVYIAFNVTLLADRYIALPCYKHRVYKKAYAAVRKSFGNIRRNVEQWRDAVLHSVSSLCLVMLHVNVTIWKCRK